MESSKTSSIGKLALIFLALLLFAIWLAYDASAALHTNLAACYDFEDDSLDDYTEDYNGTNYGTTNASGILGDGRNFSGSGQYINLTGSTNILSENGTISAWVILDTLSGGDHWILGKWGGAGSREAIFAGDGGGTDNIYQDWDGGGHSTYGLELTPGEWTQITFTWNSSGTYIYVNDTFDNSSANTWAGSTSAPLVIGRNNDGGGLSYWDGTLDQIMIWNRSLEPSEITQIHNGGASISCVEIFGGLTTDVEFTAVDDFNGSSINNFSINISWSNGTSEVYNTDNGTISLINISDSNVTVNVTYFNATDYFNLTILDESITVNVSNAVEASMFQAAATLSAREKITNNSLSSVTFYIGSKNGTEFNLTAGTHTVTAEKSGYYNLTASLTVPALSNTSYNLEGMYNSIINFTAYNALSNASISNFTVDLSFGESITTTNGSASTGIINDTNYTYNLSGPGFTSVLNQSLYINETLQRENVSLYTFNSIRFNIFNESSLSALLQSVTVHTISNLSTFSNITSTGFILIDLLEPNDYEIRFESSGFNPRSIFLSVTNDSTQNVSVYMTENTSTELQRIEVLDTANQPIEGAVVWLQKELINESDRWITIQEAQTDYNGETSVYVERDVTIFYRFAVIYEGEARPIQPSENLFTGPTSFIPGVDETIQLIIDLEEDPVDFISDDLALAVNCTLDNITANCTILDGRNSITGAEMRIEAAYINESLAWESIANTSFSGSSGTLNYTFTEINNSIWRVRVYALYATSEALVWEDEYRFDIDVIIEKNTGLLYAVIILAVVFGLTVVWGPLPSGLVGFAALIPLTAIKLISIPIGVITGLLALAVIFFFRTRKLDE